MTKINEDAIKRLISRHFVPFTHAENCEAIMGYVRAKNEAVKGGMKNLDDSKTIYVIVGPSGSGKTTIIANLYSAGLLGSPKGKFVPYVNRFHCPVTDGKPPTLEEEIAYKASLLEKGKSFVVESAQFDENYREFIKIAKLKYNYNICMLYLTKWNPQENIKMVEKRKKQGGHGRVNVELDPSILAEMYRTDSENLVEIMPYCDSCFVINNITVQTEHDKPVILLQKKLDGTFEYNLTYEYAKFLSEKILRAKPVQIRAVKCPKCFKSPLKIKSITKNVSRLNAHISGPHSMHLAILRKLKSKKVGSLSDYTQEEIMQILKGGPDKKL